MAYSGVMGVGTNGPTVTRLTHQQWLHRNARVHFRLSDGRTQVQHDGIVAKISKLIWTDPDELLDADRRLLGVNFRTLG